MNTRTWAQWPLLIALWTFVGLLFAGRSALAAFSARGAVNWPGLGWYLLDWELYLFLLPAILLLVEKLPLAGGRWPRRLPVYLAAGFGVSLVSLLMSSLMMFVRVGIAGEATWGEVFQGFWAYYRQVLGAWLFFNVGIYWSVVAVSHALRYYRKYRQREVLSAELERSLARARLKALQMQLQPHFLFNTLHAISSLMHHDVETADRMLSLLAEMLRLALDDGEVHELELGRELELLGCYLEIQQLRFPDRLRVELNIDDGALTCAVPRLILQPMVENAFRHGVAKTPGMGRIALTAGRVGEELEIVIEDSGPGIAEPVRALREGIGLSNTRRRLAQLYGDRGRLDLANVEEGGLRVTIGLPFRILPEGGAEEIRDRESSADGRGTRGSGSAAAHSPG